MRHKIKPTWLMSPLDGFSGAGSETSTHVLCHCSTMLSYTFLQEEIKAQKVESNLHEIKHPIGGSSEGVSR